MKKIIVLLVAVSLTGALLACNRNKSSSGVMLSGRESKRVLAFTEPKVDNLLKGLAEGDYAVFSKDFDPDLRKTLTESEFEKLKQEHDASLGRYYAREVDGIVKRSSGLYTVIYYVIYDKDDEVMLRVVFHARPPHQINSVYFEK